MQKPAQPRQDHRLLRRLLFPYSGDEALSFKQSRRVLLAWMVFLPLLMSVCTLVLAVILSYPLQKIGLFFLFTFLSGFFIFGSLGVLVVFTNNSSARIRQARKANDVHDTQGGGYGS
jgi:hypothetical protein